MRLLVGFRSLPLLALGLASVGFAGCMSTPATREYHEIARGRTPCDCCEDSPWCEYLSVWRGESPCGASGRATCDACGVADACGCARPVAPCARPCAPAPVSRPCAPVPVARPCAPAPVTRPCAPTPAPMPVARPVSAAPCGSWVEIPARYETVTERVMTVCATTQQVWTPPRIETVVRPVCVAPAVRTVIELPGVTKSIERCETRCPPRTEVRTKTVSDGCGGCRAVCESVTVPAAAGTRLEDVCIEGPSRVVVHEPATWSVETCDVEVTPGRWETVQIPAVYELVTKRVCVAPARREWRAGPPPAK